MRAAATDEVAIRLRKLGARSAVFTRSDEGYFEADKSLPPDNKLKPSSTSRRSRDLCRTRLACVRVAFGDEAAREPPTPQIQALAPRCSGATQADASCAVAEIDKPHRTPQSVGKSNIAAITKDAAVVQKTEVRRSRLSR